MRKTQSRVPIPQTPAAFLQSLRLRVRALPPSVAVIVVEGASDRSVLLPLADKETLVVVARGKDRLLPAYRGLDPTLRQRVLFLLDCDGRTPDELKGRVDLVLSQNRDLEADLIFELDTVHRVVLELLAPRIETRGEAGVIAERLVSVARRAGTALGIVLDVANSEGLRTRVRDSHTRRARKIRPSDVPTLVSSLQPDHAWSIRDVVVDVGHLLGWDELQVETVQRSVHTYWEVTACRHSTTRGCERCSARRFCNGHHLVDALSQALRLVLGLQTDVETLDKLVRMAATAASHDNWDVPTRIRHWEAHAGVLALSRSR